MSYDDKSHRYDPQAAGQQAPSEPVDDEYDEDGLPSAERLEPVPAPDERSRSVSEAVAEVPDVVADEGLFGTPVTEMFGLWRLSSRKRKARQREKQLAGL